MTSTPDAPLNAAGLLERLRSALPVCPFDSRSPDYWTAGKDGAACTVCGQTEDGPDKCRGADTRCMEEAATAIERLRERLLAWELQAQVEANMRMKAESALATHLPVRDETAVRAAWEIGRKSYCPAGVLLDKERTEREWEKARAYLTASKEPSEPNSISLSALEQILHDPENQPSQFGTVPVAALSHIGKEPAGTGPTFDAQLEFQRIRDAIAHGDVDEAFETADRAWRKLADDSALLPQAVPQPLPAGEGVAKLIERLKACSNEALHGPDGEWASGAYPTIYDEAADALMALDNSERLTFEISARLLRERDEARASWRQAVGLYEMEAARVDPALSALKAAEAKIAELREALERIIEFNSGDDTTLGALKTLAEIRLIAARALTKEQGNG